MEHDLYKTGDRDAPDSIKDRNGEAVLHLCKRCGKAEVELNEDCLTVTCEPCQGNGEIIVDWEAYLHPANLEAEEKSVKECPDCNGEGKVAAPPLSNGDRA